MFRTKLFLNPCWTIQMSVSRFIVVHQSTRRIQCHYLTILSFIEDNREILLFRWERNLVQSKFAVHRQVFLYICGEKSQLLVPQKVVNVCIYRTPPNPPKNEPTAFWWIWLQLCWITTHKPKCSTCLGTSDCSAPVWVLVIVVGQEELKSSSKLLSSPSLNVSDTGSAAPSPLILEYTRQLLQDNVNTA